MGGLFGVELDVKVEAAEGPVELKDSVDYVSLYGIISRIMSEPEPLLENLARKMALAMKEKHAAIREISLSVYKKNPPIPNFSGRVGVTYHKVF